MTQTVSNSSTKDSIDKFFDAIFDFVAIFSPVILVFFCALLLNKREEFFERSDLQTFCAVMYTDGLWKIKDTSLNQRAKIVYSVLGVLGLVASVLLVFMMIMSEMRSDLHITLSPIIQSDTFRYPYVMLYACGVFYTLILRYYSQHQLLPRNTQECKDHRSKNNNEA